MHSVCKKRTGDHQQFSLEGNQKTCLPRSFSRQILSEDLSHFSCYPVLGTFPLARYRRPRANIDCMIATQFSNQTLIHLDNSVFNAAKLGVDLDWDAKRIDVGLEGKLVKDRASRIVWDVTSSRLQAETISKYPDRE